MVADEESVGVDAVAAVAAESEAGDPESGDTDPIIADGNGTED